MRIRLLVAGLTIALVVAVGALILEREEGQSSTKGADFSPVAGLLARTPNTDCPAERLPANSDPVQGSVGLRAGGHPACGDIGMLAPQVFSLTDGATGLPLTDRPSLNALAGGLEFSISPDNSVLVVSAWPSLHVIDLQTWSEIASVDFPDGVPLDPQFWSPDGSKVYLRLGWASRSRTGPSIHNDRRIWELEVYSGRLTRLPDLPFDSLIDPAISGDGKLLYALAFDRSDKDYLWATRGDPFLSEVELATGVELRRIPLPGLKVGADDELVTYRPAGVLDDAAGRFYIAHADSDVITVVDLASGEVTERVATARRESLPRRVVEGLASLIVSKVEAKGGGSQQREAALSPDGRLLIVSGMNEVRADVDDANDETAAAKPAGLQIIDTRTMRVLHREEDISNFVLSDDGQYLFATGFTASFKSKWAPEQGAGLKVLDLKTMRLAAEIEPGRAYLNMALTLDGRYLHLTSEGPGRAQMRRDGLDSCGDPCIELVLDVVEVQSLELVSRQQSETSFYPISRRNNSR